MWGGGWEVGASITLLSAPMQLDLVKILPIALLRRRKVLFFLELICMFSLRFRKTNKPRNRCETFFNTAMRTDVLAF